MAHISIVPGDFTFAAWDPKSEGRFQKKVAELESQGYKLKENDQDDLNYYHIYQNAAGHRITLVDMSV